MRTSTTKQPPPVARAALTSALIGTAVIAAGAFWLSFTALTDLAARAGVARDQAWVWPLIVDGIIIVATIAAIALAGHGRTVSAYPWALLLTCAAVSVLANVTHAVVIADGSVAPAIAGGVAAVPPAALVASTHLSAVLLNRTDRRPRERAHAPLVSVTRVEPVSAQAPARERAKVAAQRPLSDLPAWFSEQVNAGHEPTGKDVAEAFGVSPATGRRRLAALRDQLVTS